MASAVVKDSSRHGGVIRGPPDIEEGEEEEELFEINLEAVNSIPPLEYYWENYFTAAATGNALLANCLLPIADVSSAVPAASTARATLSLAEQLMLLRFKTLWDTAQGTEKMKEEDDHQN